MRVSMAQATGFLARVGKGRVLLADGATGTMLQHDGLETGRIPETWLFEQPDNICSLHGAYLESGSDIILTCSFGGTSYRLDSEGLGERVTEVNRRAAELARQVADSRMHGNGTQVYVAGDMGPTGELVAPLGTVTPDEVSQAYAQQAAGLADGGADFLLLETLSDLNEAKAAIQGIQRVADLPLIVTFSFDSHGRTMMGLRPEKVAQEIGPLVQGIGANCGKDPSEFVSFMEAMRKHAPDTILWAKPNAGLPRVDGDRVVYDATPEQMAEITVQLSEAGAHVIGGCCGTTPEHVAAMSAAVGNRESA
jgi:5-methyltetrahydrofolate--homocysteine methyltransferase